jgi:hypothetical protein
VITKPADKKPEP